MIHKIKEKVVFAVVVTSKHQFADFFQWFRNMLGMDLTGYENMISEAIEKALYKLYKAYPDVYDIKITTTEVATAAAEIIVYGKIKVEENE